MGNGMAVASGSERVDPTPSIVALLYEDFRKQNCVTGLGWSSAYVCNRSFPDGMIHFTSHDCDRQCRILVNLHNATIMLFKWKKGVPISPCVANKIPPGDFDIGNSGTLILSLAEPNSINNIINEIKLWLEQ